MLRDYTQIWCEKDEFSKIYPEETFQCMHLNQYWIILNYKKKTTNYVDILDYLVINRSANKNNEFSQNSGFSN